MHNKDDVMMMQQLKSQTNKIKGDYFWDVTIRHPSKESRPEIPKEKKGKGREKVGEVPVSRLMKNSTALSDGIPGSSSGKTSRKLPTIGTIDWFGEGRHLE